MAHNVEPMDIDASVCDFDDKENSFHHNVLPRTPCTEKGYEELDISELNMKLRYSITPSASPMSKSYTAICNDNSDFENCNLTRSLHSTLNNDILKSQKLLPLQALSTDHSQIGDSNRSILKPLDKTITSENVTVTVTGPNDFDENLSLPSSSSSLAHTPEATTPTKEIPKSSGSPIMRGLKSVLSMFRPSQSPVPPAEDEVLFNQETISPPIVHSPSTPNNAEVVSASTPLCANKTKEPLYKKNCTNADSLVFNEDLEKELEWKDDPDVIFGNEKIPIHKLFFQLPKSASKINPDLTKTISKPENSTLHNATVEYMDISYHHSELMDKTATEIQEVHNVSEAPESDGEFLDAESSFKSELKFEQSFKSPETETFPTEVQETDTMNTQDSNFSDNTLDVSQSELSCASTETTKKLINTSAETNTVLLKKDICYEKEIHEDKNIHVKSNLPDQAGETEKSTIFINDIVNDNDSVVAKMVSVENVSKSNLSLENEGVSVPPVNDNAVVSSLMQIPLIADPKVLLFNVTSVYEQSATTSQESLEDPQGNIYPADVPLPDDEDIASLPSMNCALDNISNTLDLISEEIPKINQQEMSESSSNKLNSESSTTIVSEIRKEEHESKEIEYTASTSLPEKQALLNENNCANLDFKTDEPQITRQVKKDVLAQQQTTIPEIKSSYIEPIDLSMTEVQLTTTIINSKEALANIPNSCSVDVVDVSTIEIKKEPERLKYTQSNNNVDNLQERFNSQNVITDISIDKLEKPSAYLIQSDIEFIKQEIETIIDKAIQIVSEKSVVSRSELKNESELELMVDEIEKKDIHSVTINELNVIEDNEKLQNMPQIGTSQYLEKELAPVSQNIENNGVVSLECHLVTQPSEICFQHTSLQQVDAYGIICIESKDKNIEEGNDTTTFVSQMTPEITDETKNGISKTINISEPNNTIDCDIVLKTSVIHSEKSAEEEFNTSIEQTKPAEKNSVSEYNTSETIDDQEKQLVNLNTTVIELDKAPTNQAESTVLTDDKNKETERKNNVFEQSDNIILENFDNKQIQSTNLVDNVTIENPHSDLKKVINDNMITDPNIFAEETVITHADTNIGVQTDNKEQTGDVRTPDIEKIDKPAVADVEVLAPENNGPFVLVSQQNRDDSEAEPADNFEPIENPIETKSNITVTLPSSPKIVSKGYNFNFDEIEDPFATKTKIRMSPPPGTLPTQSFEKTDIEKDNVKISCKNNRTKSQPARKKLVNKKLNPNFVRKSNNAVTNSSIVLEVTQTPTAFESTIASIPASGPSLDETKLIFDNTIKSEFCVEKSSEEIPTINIKDENKTLTESNAKKSNEQIVTSSLEKSDHYSTAMSSNEDVELKMCINLPDFDDPNLNAFETKSKTNQSVLYEDKEFNPFVNGTRLCQTPPPEVQENTIVSKSYKDEFPKFRNGVRDLKVNASDLTVNLDSETKIGMSDTCKLIEDENPENLSFTTSSSRNDKDTSTKTINTEDEDTIEGPFLEAEDLISGEINSEYIGDNGDIMQISERPIGNEENAEAGEMFIDAEAFEFLWNQNKTDAVTDSGKESLFLKFDPLFSKRVSSDGVLAALSKVQTKQSTPKKTERSPHPIDLTFDKSFVPRSKPSSPKNKEVRSLPGDATFDKSPLPGPSRLSDQNIDSHNTTEDGCDDLNITVSKPMMVVNPAVNPVVTPRNKSITPVRSNRQSLTFTSPAIAVIDRLLSMSSANNSFMTHDTTVAEGRRDNEADLALTQLRELLADKEISVYNLRTESKELKDRLATMESQMKNLEAISEERLKNITQLNEKLDEKTKHNRRMAKVVEEYERTIASLISEMEQDKKRHAEERIQLITERDEQAAHLASMEISFNDLHSKYEKSKQVIMGFKANEDMYKKSIKEFEENLTKMQKNYELLKQHASSKLNFANEELQKINRAHEAEVLKLNALIKRKELHITSLEETLQQKTKANEELTAICDELINKVG